MLQASKYYIDNGDCKFKSLDELLDHYKSHPVPNHPDLMLKMPYKDL